MVKGKPIEIDVTKWGRSINRFVGFIDIMGFKDMVTRNNEEVLYQIMRRIREYIFQNVLIYGVGDPEEYYNAVENLRVNTSGYLRMYIDKTLQYLEFFKSNCLEIVE